MKYVWNWKYMISVSQMIFQMYLVYGLLVTSKSRSILSLMVPRPCRHVTLILLFSIVAVLVLSHCPTLQGQFLQTHRYTR